MRVCQYIEGNPAFIKIMEISNFYVGNMPLLGWGYVLYTFFLSNIGKKNEYSLQIRLNVTNKMFITLTDLFIAFILVVPSGLF